MNIQEYINNNLPLAVRHNVENKDTLIGLPYPYSIPTVEESFQELYYWDTYFTNRGLLRRGDIEQAKNNIDNIFYLIERYGFMPNGNRTYYLYNSQPPFLALMVKEIYDIIGDKSWLKKAYSALSKEHIFWQEKRMTQYGLNRYCGESQPLELKQSYAKAMTKRMRTENNFTEDELAWGLLSAAESGWDCTPRMGCETYNYLPIDLNSLLYAQEDCLALFAKILGMSVEEEKWIQRKDKRRSLCRKYLETEEGIFYDFNMRTGNLNMIASAACFYPLYCGMASSEEAEAALELLPRIEAEHGIVTCEACGLLEEFQWGYPNGWAPMQWIVVEGLYRYGFKEDALRIAAKFVKTVECCFEKTGHLWEKYNVVEGNVNVTNEYDMPPMLGWTFGVYTELCDLLTRNNR